jgi:hypothetical protein
MLVSDKLWGRLLSVQASDAKKILLARELYQACLTKALMFRDFGNVASWKVVNQPHIGRVFVANNLKVSTNLALALQIQTSRIGEHKDPVFRYLY